MKTGPASERALAQAEKQELPIPRQPVSDVPALPTDVTELTDSALMKLFRRLMGWQKFLATQLALAEADEKYYARNLARRKERYDKRKAADKEEAAQDTTLQELEESHSEADAYRRLVASLYAGLESDTFLCSRELTRRLGTADRDHREARWNT